MKYTRYILEDFVKDEYFQKWVLNPDSMTNNFWQNWVADHPDKRDVIEKAKRLVLLMDFDTDALSQKDFDAMWRHIIEKRNDIESEIKNSKKLKRYYLVRVAAVFIGFIALGLGLYNQGYFTTNTAVVGAPQITLELEDGSVTVLDETATKYVTNTNGKQVVKQDKNTLQYTAKNSAKKTLQYNVLTVPYGKKFGVMLSDGSHVFLNSGTKLRYPVHFLPNTPRNVYLDGEAFFTIQKDKSRPFTVITDEMNAKVYGTSFNMSSYKNEKNTSTVLVEGSVGVYRANNGNADKPITIKPGQRAVFHKNGIQVEEANVSKYIAWKEDKLLFVDDTFDLMLKELERHFNVDIKNEYTALGHKKFTGTFKKESLDQILQICKQHTSFKYTIKGDNIVITEPSKK